LCCLDKDLRAAAKAKLRARSFSSSLIFSVKLSAASFLRLGLIIEIPLLEFLPLVYEPVPHQNALELGDVNRLVFKELQNPGVILRSTGLL
jgi:hypothetical protein